jgi:hypothetical protein
MNGSGETHNDFMRSFRPRVDAAKLFYCNLQFGVISWCVSIGQTLLLYEWGLCYAESFMRSFNLC